ncbi:CPBP family intramembrane glutamic endopeptidase [Egicoccus sp. AB-alg2]|uniref:CPBP family intramembrane glutamic endopeptidase n=1 Tax=Egicoccus sp. AB-alg2 TaxID=3242693 RepID=UPI00359F0B07
MARLADRPFPRARDEEGDLLVPLAVSGALLTWSVGTNLGLGDEGYLERNVALAVGLWWLARRLGYDAAELGLGRASLRRGTVVGALAFAAVAVAVALGVALRDRLPIVDALLADQRADLAPSELVHQVLLRIPVGTAAFEEFAFRGFLLAVLLRHLDTRTAWLWAAAVFGLWHVPPTIVTLRMNGVAPASGEGLVAVAGAVAVTAVAGLGFTWLRRHGGHLVAPVLAHWATNATGLLAAAAARSG